MSVRQRKTGSRNPSVGASLLSANNGSSKTKATHGGPPGSSGGTDGSGSPCGGCKKGIVDEECSSVLCDLCHKWYHLGCTRLSESNLGFLSKTANLGVRWFCDKCDNITVSLEERLVGIENSINKIIPQITTVSSDKSYAEALTLKLDEAAQQNKVMQQQVSKQIQNIKSDIQTENRSRNLIIFGLREAEQDGKNQVVESVTTVMKECGYNASSAVGQVTRLGARKDGKARPIKVSMSSEADKWELLRRINSVKPDGIFARLDLTKEEQLQDFQLRTKLKQTRQENPTNKYKIIKNQIVQIP